MFWFTLILKFGLHNLRFERCVFIEQHTMSPMFGLFNFEGYDFSFHVTIIVEELFIVNNGF